MEVPLLESIDDPLLLIQGNPRQVVSANRKALELFGKAIDQVKDHRGGQVFDCVHSFTEAGCGKDVNCEPCTIRKAIVDTLESGNAHDGVSSELQVRKGHTMETFALKISTERLGEHALVRVRRYERS